MNLNLFVESKVWKHLYIYSQNIKLFGLYLYKEGLCSVKPMKLSLDSLKYKYLLQFVDK